MTRYRFKNIDYIEQIGPNGEVSPELAALGKQKKNGGWSFGDISASFYDFVLIHNGKVVAATGPYYGAREFLVPNVLVPNNVDAEGPDWDDLRGRAPDATGDLSSEDFIRQERDSWDRGAQSADAKSSSRPISAPPSELEALRKRVKELEEAAALYAPDTVLWDAE